MNISSMFPYLCSHKVILWIISKTQSLRSHLGLAWAKNGILCIVQIQLFIINYCYFEFFSKAEKRTRKLGKSKLLKVKWEL